MNNTQLPVFTTGRKKIFCYEDSITAENVKGVVEAALLVHNHNVKEIEWLFELYRGKDTVIENRVREGVNEDVNHKANVNYYSLIADYASNLFMQNPMVHVNVDGDATVGEKLKQYNKIQRVANRYARDKTTSIHASVCGVAYRFIEIDKRFGYKDSVLSPTSVFSLYGDDTDDRAMAKVYISQVRDGVAGEDITQEIGTTHFGIKNRYTVYTDEHIFEWVEGDKEVSVNKAMPWGCPIVEYRLNPFYIGTFERVTNLIHLLSVLRSDGVNGVVQSIAGFILGKNVGLPMDNEDDTEEERKFKEEQRAEFRHLLKKYRQIWTEDSKENPVSVEYIATELFNADIDVLYNGLKEDIIYITRTPNSIMNLGASGNAGAATTASGMTQALENAKNAEPFWFESAREQAYIELAILEYENKLKDLDVIDFDFAMQRSIDVNLQEATQSFATLVGSGVPPSDAARVTRLTPDPDSWEKRMIDWEKKVYELDKERRKEDDKERTSESGGAENGNEESTSEETKRHQESER